MGKDKLIQLLNEFEGLTEAEACEMWYIDEYGRLSEGGWRTQGTNTWICSKKFGFIKRLVENDKIKKSYKEGLPAITKNGFLLEGDTALLMLLATQDEPIEFLISILK